ERVEGDALEAARVEQRGRIVEHARERRLGGGVGGQLGEGGRALLARHALGDTSGDRCRGEDAAERHERGSRRGFQRRERVGQTRLGVRPGAVEGEHEPAARPRSEEHTSELQSRENIVCRLLLEKKKKTSTMYTI